MTAKALAQLNGYKGYIRPMPKAVECQNQKIMSPFKRTAFKQLYAVEVFDDYLMQEAVKCFEVGLRSPIIEHLHMKRVEVPDLNRNARKVREKVELAAA